MILFKACTRCGGDIDISYEDDIYCVQCGYRPASDLPHPLAVPRPADESASPIAEVPRTVRRKVAVGVDSEVSCAKCGFEQAVQLDKLRPRDNACYRCRLCGHIFSPGADELPDAASARTQEA